MKQFLANCKILTREDLVNPGHDELDNLFTTDNKPDGVEYQVQLIIGKNCTLHTLPRFILADIITNVRCGQAVSTKVILAGHALEGSTIMLPIQCIPHHQVAVQVQFKEDAPKDCTLQYTAITLSRDKRDQLTTLEAVSIPPHGFIHKGGRLQLASH